MREALATGSEGLPSCTTPAFQMGRPPLSDEQRIFPIRISSGSASRNLPGTRPGGPQRVIIATSWVIDSQWVTSQRSRPGRRIMMTCSYAIEPDM
jgi:hypothetical protein